MRIELENLADTGGRFAHTYEPGQLILSEDRVQLADAATVTGRVTQRKTEISVTGQIKARVRVECDRCLNLVELPVETTFSLDYVTPQTYIANPTAELSEDDMDLSVFDGEALDVDELVGEQLLLALPSRVLCQETCKGLCPVCGGDRNLAQCTCESKEIDPRWSALKELAQRE